MATTHTENIRVEGEPRTRYERLADVIRYPHPTTMTTENTTVWVRGKTYRKLREKKEEKNASSYNELIDEALDEI